jgi:hypothetical protein
MVSERESECDDGNATAALYDSYCGPYCGACDTLMATEQGSVPVHAREWKRTAAELQVLGA